MRLARLLALAALPLALPATASAQAPLPLCPNDVDVFATTAPGFVRVGQVSMAVTLSRDTDRRPSTNISVSVDGVTTSISSTEPVIDAVVAVAPSDDAVRVVFDWDQDLGTPAACHGRDVHDVPVIADDARAGRPGVGRLSGRYRVRYERLGPTGTLRPSRWTLAPQCDVFGCSARLKSTGGARGLVRLLDDGSYRFQEYAGLSGRCEVYSQITGDVYTIKPSYSVSHRASIRVLETRHGVATRFRGKFSYIYRPTPRASEISGCDTVSTAEYRIRGTRIRTPR